jgi:hypothetical protein
MTMTIDHRYNGPPDSGNGGYVAGVVARELLTALDRPCQGPGSPWVAVTLRTPPPLDTPYETTLVDGSLQVTVGDVTVAEAQVADPPDPVDPVEPVERAIAVAAEQRYVGLHTHPFPTCWVCGTERPDGYHLRPGAATEPTAGASDERTACLWVVTPDAAPGGAGPVPSEAVWAALDCPGGWTALVHGRVVVLGRMTARVAATPAVGDECVVMGRPVGTEGRKTWTATSVYSADGTELARAHGTWIAIDLP